MKELFKTFLIALAIFLLTPLTTDARSYVDDETPIEIQIAANKWGGEYNICPELIIAICYQESKFNEKAVNPDGTCYGVMQIQVKSHTDRMKRLGVTDLTDIDQCVHVGADYLAELFERYEDTAIVLGMYHGESKAQEEISAYTDAILTNSERLERLHGK